MTRRLRHVLGHVFALLGFGLCVIAELLVHAGAWLLDREDEIDWERGTMKDNPHGK